jgi:endonuclease I
MKKGYYNMRTLSIAVVVLFLMVTVVSGFAQGNLVNEKYKYENQNGELVGNVNLTDDTDLKYINRLNSDINKSISKAVSNREIEELESFKLRRSFNKLFNFKSAQNDKNVKFEDIKKNINSNYKNSELINVLKKAEKILSIKGDYSSAAGLKDEALKIKLRTLVSKHKNLGYRGARTIMFSELDNRDGYVECVYTGRKVKTNQIPSAQGAQSMNCEHTWPKSRGAKQEPAKADLFHLYPTDSKSNSIRSSLHFGNIGNSSKWSQGGSKCNGSVFMPRAEHRGNVARAIFYFSVVYNKKIGAKEETTLKKWHKDDPADSNEIKRNEDICKYQGNRNPFIDRPDFVSQISDF